MSHADAQRERASAAAERLAARRAAKAASKQAERGTGGVPAPLVQRTQRAAQWLDANRRALTTGALAAAGLVVAALAVQQWSTRAESAAGHALEGAIATAAAPIADESATDVRGERYPDSEARAQAAAKAYAGVVGAYAGKPAAAWALAGEAAALADLGKHAEALAAYTKVLAMKSSYPKWLAVEGAGIAEEALGKHADALRRFEELAAMEEGAYRIAGDVHRARVLAATDKPDKALEILDALIEAERSRGPEQPAAFAARVDDARVLRAELAVALGKPKLDDPVAGGAEGINAELLEQIRSQLKAQGVDAPTPIVPAPAPTGAEE